MSESRTVPLTVKTDRILAADHGGIICYNNGATNINVTLPGGTQPMFCQVSVLGTGTVTLIADPQASLNGTVGGTMVLTANTPYWLSVHFNAKGAAAWFCK